MGLAGETFEAVLAAAQEGDEFAWTRLYTGVAGALKAYARLRGARDPDDIVGETFLQLARNLKRFEGDEQGFRSWAFTVTHHRIIDERRKEGRRPRSGADVSELRDELAGGHDVEAEVMQEAGMAWVHETLDPLTEEQREVILLRVLGGLSVAQTAHALGRTNGAVRALQHRAF